MDVSFVASLQRPHFNNLLESWPEPLQFPASFLAGYYTLWARSSHVVSRVLFPFK